MSLRRAFALAALLLIGCSSGEAGPPASSAGGAAGAAGASQDGGATDASDAGGAGGTAGSGGSTGMGGAAGSSGAGGSVSVTCKQAGGDRCGAAAADCAGLVNLASSDCASCCRVPSNPVFATGWADPFIVRRGDTYFAFATGGTVRRRSSKDLVSWSKVDTALDSAPWKKASSGFWAPTVYRNKNGKWVSCGCTV